MLLNEIAKETGMTKRAVKYYEEKGLLSVHKDGNGYRNYSPQDVETLKKISVYRKLGISIKDIQSLLKSGDKSILLRIYQEKMRESVLFHKELYSSISYPNSLNTLSKSAFDFSSCTRRSFSSLCKAFILVSKSMFSSRLINSI